MSTQSAPKVTGLDLYIEFAEAQMTAEEKGVDYDVADLATSLGYDMTTTEGNLEFKTEMDNAIAEANAFFARHKFEEECLETLHEDVEKFSWVASAAVRMAFMESFARRRYTLWASSTRQRSENLGSLLQAIEHFRTRYRRSPANT